MAGARGSGVSASLTLQGLLGIMSLLVAGLLVPTRLQAEERDPFVFGHRVETLQDTGEALSGVLWDAARPMAIVGEHMVGVGSFVGSWEIIAIHEDSVIVQRGDRREQILPGAAFPE